MINIENVQAAQATDDPSLLWDCFLDFPHCGISVATHSLEIIGWVLGKRAPLAQIRVEHAGMLVAKISNFVPRPDVTKAFPNVHIENCGFQVIVNMIGLPETFELEVKAEFIDGFDTVIASIHGKQSPLCPVAEPPLQPLIITTLGRTGSTWLTHLLGSHPQIVTYRPFKSEPRVCTYWAQVLLTLGNPSSYMQALAADLSNEFWWLGTKPLPFNLEVADPELLDEMGDPAIQELATLCRNRIEAFYLKVAQIQNKSGSRYFAEKASPDQTPLVVRNLYPKSREIILVRDFRDMLCSIIAYSAKLGFTGFGSAGFADRGHYVWKLRTDILKIAMARRSRPDTHLVRYEDLITSPAETMSGIFRHLGVDHSEEDLAEFSQNASREVPGSSFHRTTADSAQSIGRWKTELDDTLKATCQEALGDLLTEFGYSRD